MLATVMRPASVSITPLYNRLYYLRLIDGYGDLVLPRAVNVLGILLFR